MFRHRLRVRWKSKLFQALREERLCLSGFAEQALGIQESREGFRSTGEYRLIGLGSTQKLHTGLCVRAGGWAQQVRIISAYR
jgi:hypothetical protein